MRVVSVNVGRPVVLLRNDRRYSTAINKRPVTGPVELTPAGFVGDRVADLENHGGPDKAALCYPSEHYDYWRQRLGRDLDVPAFGENLTLSGLLEEEACLGDLFRIGGAAVQVSQPRQPCWKLAAKHDKPELVRWVNETCYTGFYVRVNEPGGITAGDEIALLDRPYPELTVALATRTLLARPADRELLSRLAELPVLSASWREETARRLASP